VRPTELTFVAADLDMLFVSFKSEVDGGHSGRRRSSRAGNAGEWRSSGRPCSADGFVLGEYGLGGDLGRIEGVRWSSYLDLHLVEGYGSTEAGAIFVDGQVRRPPVIDYKLVDVPDLGYFHTDQPQPQRRARRENGQLVPRLLQAVQGHR